MAPNYKDLYGTNSYMPGLFGLYAENRDSLFIEKRVISIHSQFPKKNQTSNLDK
jgi:hypothetical protein